MIDLPMITILSYRKGQIFHSSRKSCARLLHNYHANRSAWLWKDTGGLQEMVDPVDYSKWSSEQLIDRVKLLEQQLQEQATRSERRVDYFILSKLSLT